MAWATVSSIGSGAYGGEVDILSHHFRLNHFHSVYGFQILLALHPSCDYEGDHNYAVGKMGRPVGHISTRGGSF